MNATATKPMTRKLWEIKGRGYYACCTELSVFNYRKIPAYLRPNYYYVSGWFESPTALPPEAFDLSKYLPLIGRALPKGHEQHVGRKSRQHFESTGAVRRKGGGR